MGNDVKLQSLVYQPIIYNYMSCILILRIRYTYVIDRHSTALPFFLLVLAYHMRQKKAMLPGKLWKTPLPIYSKE